MITNTQRMSHRVHRHYLCSITYCFVLNKSIEEYVTTIKGGLEAPLKI